MNSSGVFFMCKMIVIAVLFLSSAVFANSGACKADREKFCADAKGDRKKMFQCMQDNADKLSSECKAQRDKAREKLKDLAMACGQDVEVLCPDVDPGDLRLMRCLRENRDKLSESCKEKVKEIKKDRKSKK